jgi:hypothetical protein
MATITGLDPGTGPEGGGTVVNITGDGLIDVIGVGFDAVSAIDVSIVSDTLVTAATPAGTGMAAVSILFTDGTELDAGVFAFTPNAAFGDVTISSPSQLPGPGRTIHPITPDLAMPHLSVNAPLVGVSDDATAVRRFRLEVTYDDGHRHDTVYVPTGGGFDVVTGPDWSPDFAGMYAGGDLAVFIEADRDPVGTLYWSSPLASAGILGLNPTHGEVRGRVNDEANVSVVFHRESRFTQFKTTLNTSNAYVGGPHPPLRGLDPKGTVGYGAGQLTVDPEPTVEELWNWAANVDSAYTRLMGLREDAVVYQQQVQQGLAWTGQTGGDPPHKGTAYPDAPDFTDDQLDLEMYARYNGRYRYHNYDPATMTWVRRLPVGQDKDTSLPYADEVESVKEEVLAGHYPVGW